MTIEPARVHIVGRDAENNIRSIVLVVDVSRTLNPLDYRRFVQDVQADALRSGLPPAPMREIRDIQVAFSDGAVHRWVAAPGFEVYVPDQKLQPVWSSENPLVDALLQRDDAS